jgi:hypothetical protein
MAARTTMATLITQLRLMVNDTDSLMFTDNQLQDVLDQRAYIANYEPMMTLENILPGGTVEYKEFQSEHQYFESDAILTSGTFAELTPDTSDFKLAYFTFITSQIPPILIYGWYYDMNAAAADVFDLKAAKYADGFDFSADGGTFSLSQKVAQAEKQASRYRSMSLEASEMEIITRIDVIS